MSVLERIGQLVENKTRELDRGASELTSRGLADIRRLQADEPMLKAVAVLQDSRNWSARIQAWEALREMGPKTAGWQESLIDLIFHGDGWARIFAAEALALHASCATEAVPVLLATLESTLETGSYDWSRLACGALGHFPSLPRPLIERSLPLLIDALHVEDPDVRGYAAQALGHWGKLAKPALVDLAELCETSPEPLKSLYCEAVRQISPASSSALDALVAGLDDPTPERRARAVTAIAHRGQRAAAALPQLLSLFQDPSAEVRYHLALALGEMDPAEPLLEKLRLLAADGDDRVRLAASLSLVKGSCDEGHHLAQLRASLRSPAASLRLFGAKALGEVGRRTPWRSRRCLKGALQKESDDQVKAALHVALAKLKQA